MTQWISERLSPIIEHSGIGPIQSIQSISGGDINEAFCLEGREKYFLKINSATRYPKMFEREADGLKALSGLNSRHVPTVINTGEVDDTQYLVLGWIAHGRPRKDFWELFGRSLTELHQRTQSSFGYKEDNYIGSLAQQNNLKQTWAQFYAECRIMPLIAQLKDDGLVDSMMVKSGEQLCTKIKDIFPIEKPSLLHGDLWNGNFMTTSDGTPAIYDPAVYYGHREMDLGMTQLFGGFDSRFYDAYHESFPLEKKWKERMELTQLYPLLVHAVLFGGGYVGQVISIIRNFS